MTQGTCSHKLHVGVAFGVVDLQELAGKLPGNKKKGRTSAPAGALTEQGLSPKKKRGTENAEKKAQKKKKAAEKALKAAEQATEKPGQKANATGKRQRPETGAGTPSAEGDTPTAITADC